MTNKEGRAVLRYIQDKHPAYARAYLQKGKAEWHSTGVTVTISGHPGVLIQITHKELEPLMSAKNSDKKCK